MPAEVVAEDRPQARRDRGPLGHCARGQLDDLVPADLHDASHELRTPIAVLRGEIDLALGAVDDPVEVRQSLLAAKGQVVRRVEVSGDPVIVEADADRLRQVLTNLAANSAAAGATTARVTVIADQESATLRWADDGPGFAAGLLDSAFERFVRGDASRAPSTGAGLGLSIVRAVVTAHGGTTSSATAAPLGGAVVTVRLPFSAPGRPGEDGDGGSGPR